MTVEIRTDDLTGDATRRLIARHLAGVRALSPAESVHALDIDALRDAAITFWSAWVDGEIAGIGALKMLDEERGEIKSMRVDDRFLGAGVGRGLLTHIVSEARERGIRSLWLERGSSRPSCRRSGSTRARASCRAHRSRATPKTRTPCS